MSSALAGLKVLDIASLYAAPYAATLLADFGADVVKVEPPGGDGFRGTKMWPIVARGKRSLVLDLRDPEAADALRAMIANVDVLVENYPPEVLARRGLDWATLSVINPRLVMLSVSCFGQTGPSAGRPGSGTIAEGFAGLAHLMGETDGAPMLPSVALGDAIGAMNAVIGVMTALYWRDRGGAGQQIDASLYEPVLVAIAQAFQFWEADTAHPARRGSRLAVGQGIRNIYATSDGKHVAISASTSRHTDTLVALAGGAEFDDADCAVSRWIATQPLAPLVAQLVAARVPVTPVNTLDALLADPQIVARGSIARHEDPSLGTMLSPAPSPKLSATPGRIRDFGPSLGAGGPEALADWGGLDATCIASLATRWTSAR